jgi:1-acyl-sn-glycerol-3-phosphate acyltransferase
VRTGTRTGEAPVESGERAKTRDRTRLAMLWYRLVQVVTLVLFTAIGGLRATGRQHLPASGGVLLVSNHLSFLDVFVLAIPLPRPLNYVARSTLFFPPLGALMRSVGAFPIQREGMGAQGLKETLRRLRDGGIVTLFPEGTRSPDGELREMKTGIASLAGRARVPVLPVGIAGTFEAWPRTRPFPAPHAIRIHYGPAITPEEIAGLDPEAITTLIRDRIDACRRQARRDLDRDLGRDRDLDRDEIAVG